MSGGHPHGSAVQPAPEFSTASRFFPLMIKKVCVQPANAPLQSSTTHTSVDFLFGPPFPK